MSLVLHPQRTHLQLSQNRIRTGHRNLTRPLLALSIHDLSMVKHHSPAPIALAQVPAMVLREKGLGIAQKQDLLALHAIDLAPSIHDPAVIGSNGRDDVDALLGELAAVLDVWGEVVGLATGGMLVMFLYGGDGGEGSFTLV